MGTAVVLEGSDIQRQSWMSEGLAQAASESMWGPYSGMSRDAIVYQKNDLSKGAGHTVVFDWKGNLSQRAVKGKEQAVGKGESKKKFSDKLTVEIYRLVVDNGDKFDGVDIGDMTINEHSDSRSGLADLFIRFKDQALCDAAQGNLKDNGGTAYTPTHHLNLGTTFDINSLTDIETRLKTGRGWDAEPITAVTGGKRRPPEPFKTEGGKKIWLFAVDTEMAAVLKKSTGYQSLVYNADVRGNNNRSITGIIGKLGNLLIVEFETFFGNTAAGASWNMDDSDIEIAGLRQYDVTNSAWTGQAGFNHEGNTTILSRGVILGAGALSLAFGKMPDYNVETFDFKRRSESCVEFWTECRKTKLLAENVDYDDAKIADVDWGVVTVDVQVQTVV